MALADLVAPIPDTAHANAILELAFVVSAVDGTLADEEQAAFAQVVAAVRGRPVEKAEIDALLGSFLMTAQGIGGADRLRELAAELPGDLREAAFKLVIGLTLVDHEENEQEDELVGILAASLGLAERSIPLTAEAREAYDR